MSEAQRLAAAMPAQGSLEEASEDLAERTRALEEHDAERAALVAAVSAAQSNVTALELAAAGKPRRLLTAYFLWLFCPAYPWYALYLGRDLHAWLYTVSFGGFGTLWLVDGLCIPWYVYDWNAGAPEVALMRERSRAAFTARALLAPLRWIAQIVISSWLGVVALNVLPTPPAALWPRDGSAPPVVHLSSALAIGCAAWAIVMTTRCVGGARRRCDSARGVVGWMVLVASVLLAPDDNRRKPRGERAFDLAMLIIVSTVGVLCAQYTRAFDERIEPRRASRRRLTVRLAVQLVGVGAFAAAASGALYFNGSFTYTDKETGESITLQGPEIFRDAASHLSNGYAAVLPLWQQFRNHVEHVGWEKLWQEIRDALKDKTAEAARELEMEDQELTPANIRRAHRKLALANHPDKVAGKGKAAEAEAAAREEKMNRLNNAKELLLKRLAESD